MSSEAGKGGARAADSYRGRLFVVSSPSGGGKGTLIRRALEEVPGLSYSVSWTTRQPRKGEMDGVDYHFVSREEFEEIKAGGGFLEWALVHGNFYGTARSVVEQELSEGHDVILEIDVQGAEAVRAATDNVIGVFIMPPSFDVLRQRLSSRGTDDPKTVELRLANSAAEVSRYAEFDYVIVNDDVGRASLQLAAVIYAERARRECQEWLVRRVLQTFPAPPAVE